MIMRKLFFTVLLAALATGPGAVSAQQARVALKGNAYMIKDGKAASLEVDGKIVCTLDDGYVDFKTATGNYFAAEFDDGRFVLLNRKGRSVVLGPRDEIDYYKISLVSGTVVAQKEKDSKPKYYSEKDLSVEITPQAVGANFFEEEIEKKGGFSPKLAGQRADVEAMEKALAEAEPIGYFELRNNDKGSLDLVVDGKVLFTSNSFRLLSDAAEYKKSNCWFFRISRGNHYPRYGVYAIAMFMEEGKKVVQNQMMIPYEYTFIAHDGGNMVRCTKQGGAIGYFNWWGWRFEVDRQTRKFVSTNERWEYDKATDKWSLKKQESKE